MSTKGFRHIYGPVPSRRLGRSLGIDLVPFKTCTYDCIYCQLGRTTDKTVERREYVPVGAILEELDQKLAEGDVPDYISLAGSGEPTLHSGIGDLIQSIKAMTPIPVAVITNGSLLWKPDVAESLMAADLVIPSLDAGDERMFRYVNRPHREIDFKRMVKGLAHFTGLFTGSVWLEVFLLAGLTGIPSEVEKIAKLVKRIRPMKIQLNTVSRPPAEEIAGAVALERMRELCAMFPGGAEVVYQGSQGVQEDVNADGVSNEDILAIIARRPCTAEDVATGLGKHPLSMLKRLEKLVAEGRARRVLTDGKQFYTATATVESR